MKAILLADGRQALVDDEDFESLSAFRWKAKRTSARSNTWYAVRQPYDPAIRNSRLVYMHREILPGVAGVDHIDGDGLNNQRSNLRPATASMNGANSRVTTAIGGRSTTSTYKGVTWHRVARKWMAQIMVDRRHRYLGLFSNEADAARAYDAAAREAFAEYARVNVPVEAT